MYLIFILASSAILGHVFTFPHSDEMDKNIGKTSSFQEWLTPQKDLGIYSLLSLLDLGVYFFSFWNPDRSTWEGVAAWSKNKSSAVLCAAVQVHHPRHRSGMSVWEIGGDSCSHSFQKCVDKGEVLEPAGQNLDSVATPFLEWNLRFDA